MTPSPDSSATQGMTGTQIIAGTQSSEMENTATILHNARAAVDAMWYSWCGLLINCRFEFVCACMCVYIYMCMCVRVRVCVCVLPYHYIPFD